METLKQTDYKFPGLKGSYRGKVRDVYFIDPLIVMIASDRISAFDFILPSPIPYKGQILNRIACHFLKQTEDIVPNWLISMPAPNVSIGYQCKPLMVEMVIRGYLSGHAWREYRDGKREICGVPMPDGMKENDPFPEPIITPTTKALEGHDEDISKEEIIAQGIVDAEVYASLEKITRQLFKRGQAYAQDKGLILVDTKYEFGMRNGEIHLIDEIHTPDSSRYFYKDTYNECQQKGLRQKQLSKEFVREWLISEGFQGKTNQTIPEMTPGVVKHISDRYIELYEQVTGKKFDYSPIPSNLEEVIINELDIIQSTK